MLLLSVLTMNYSCAALFDAELGGGQDLPLTKEGLLDLEEMSKRLDKMNELYENGVVGTYPKSYIGAAAGLGLNSIEGESTTSYCFGGEYNHRVYENNNNSAGYVGAFAQYHAETADESDLNLFKGGIKYTHFDRITANGEVDLTYGINAFYETGSSESFGFKDDITGYGASLTLGANFKISDKLAFGVEVPFLTHRQRTFESESSDQEFDQSATWFGLNKGNVAMASLRINLDGGNSN